MFSAISRSCSSVKPTDEELSENPPLTEDAEDLRVGCSCRASSMFGCCRFCPPPQAVLAVERRAEPRPPFCSAILPLGCWLPSRCPSGSLFGCLYPPPTTDSRYRLYPVALDVRPPLVLDEFLLVACHRAVDAANAVPALVVEFAVRNADHVVQKLPHVAFRPVDDGRYEQRLLAVYAAQRLLVGGIGDVHAVALLTALLASFLVLLFPIFVKLFERALELMVAYLHFLALCPSGAFLLSDADERHLACTCHLLELLTAPSGSHRRQNAHPYGDVIDTVLRLGQCHVGVLLLDKAYHFGWVNTCQIHVRFELYPPPVRLHDREPGCPFHR